MKYVIALVLALAASSASADQSCDTVGNDTACYGTDGDRNYETHCHSDGAGHSYCSSNYTN